MGFFGKIFGGSSEAKRSVIDTALTIGAAIGTIGGAIIGGKVIRGMAKSESEVELPEEIEVEADPIDETEPEEVTEEEETK